MNKIFRTFSPVKLTRPGVVFFGLAIVFLWLVALAIGFSRGRTINGQVIKKLIEEKAELTNKQAAAERQIKRLLEKQNNDPLKVFQSERAGGEVCGFGESQAPETIWFSKKPNAIGSYVTSRGIWTNNCSKYLFPVEFHGDRSPYPVPRTEKLEGIWEFRWPEGKYTNVWPGNHGDPVRWLTENLFSNGREIFDVNKRLVVETIAPMSEFVRYRNTEKLWMFRYHPNWTVKEADRTLTIDTGKRVITIYDFVPEKFQKINEDKYGAAIFGSAPRREDFTRYYSAIADPAEIYVGSGSTFPPIITVGKPYTDQGDLIFGINELISTIEPIK